MNHPLQRWGAIFLLLFVSCAAFPQDGDSPHPKHSTAAVLDIRSGGQGWWLYLLPLF
jgi:hypothetical protein